MKSPDAIVRYITLRIGYLYYHRPLMFGGTGAGGVHSRFASWLWACFQGSFHGFGGGFGFHAHGLGIPVQVTATIVTV